MRSGLEPPSSLYDPAIHCNDVLTNKTLILRVSHSISPFVSKRLNVSMMCDEASLKVDNEYMWSGHKSFPFVQELIIFLIVLIVHVT